MTAGPCAGVAARLSGATGLLVSLDFDGTLAPIADDPDTPAITPAARRAVSLFVASPRATVAVVSGRELADLRSRVGLDDVVYAGNHGLELASGGDREVHPVAERARPALGRALDRLRERLAHIPGWEIEDKGVTATVHVRHTPTEWIDEVRSAVEAVVRRADGELWTTTGKAVFELRPAVDWDKGAAVAYLSDGIPDGWVTMHVGDDTTDEHAFRAILPDGIAVHVGSDRETTAPHRLPTQESVPPFLEWVADHVLEAGELPEEAPRSTAPGSR